MPISKKFQDAQCIKALSYEEVIENVILWRAGYSSENN